MSYNAYVINIKNLRIFHQGKTINISHTKCRLRVILHTIGTLCYEIFINELLAKARI